MVTQATAEARDTAVGILKKLGVADADKFDGERAVKKLAHRLEKQGAPADLNSEEKGLLEDMGFGASLKEGKKSKEELKASAKADQAAAEAKAAAKTAAEPGKKRKADAKVAKAPKEKNADDPKDAKASKPRGEGSSAIFKALMADGKAHKKADIIAKIAEKGGCTPATAASYVVWAKSSPTNKPYNPFGFQIEETKGKDGSKLIRMTDGIGH